MEHVRIVDGGTPKFLTTREALAEINLAMLAGKKAVVEMSASRSSAIILYKDGTRVVLRPATDEDREATSEELDAVAATLTPHMAASLAGARLYGTDRVYAHNIRNGGGTDGALLRRGLIEKRDGVYYRSRKGVALATRLAELRGE